MNRRRRKAAYEIDEQEYATEVLLENDQDGNTNALKIVVFKGDEQIGWFDGETADQFTFTDPSELDMKEMIAACGHRPLTEIEQLECNLRDCKEVERRTQDSLNDSHAAYLRTKEQLPRIIQSAHLQVALSAARYYEMRRLIHQAQAKRRRIEGEIEARRSQVAIA